FLPRGGDLLFEFLLESGVPLLAPFLQTNQVLLQSLDRVAERPGGGFRLGTIAGGVVAGGMSRCAIGHELDERRTQAFARALGGPTRYRVDRQEVIAVDANSWNSKSRPSRRERGTLASCDSLRSGDGPLIVDDVENDWSVIDRSKHHCIVHIRFSCGA